MTSILGRILQVKREEIARSRGKALPPEPRLRQVKLRRQPGGPLKILAEIKLRSPSAGPLSTQLTVSERAACYERAGASMISVLCDSAFFDGAYEHLAIARQASSLPLLCKEFIIDEVQLDWARAYGADAVLLIARCGTRDILAQLQKAAEARGLLPLVEVANPEESRWATQLGCPVIGVNARDLDTLQMDREQAANVLNSLPEDRIRIHLSGLKTPAHVSLVSQSGVDAALVGEVLMRQDDPEPLLRSLVGATQQVP
jgi:indole-3-glycerol phosphate synthase